MKNWLDKKRQGEWGALQEHTEILKSLSQGDVLAETAAKKLMESITTAKKPSGSVYRFCELLLSAAAERGFDEIAKSFMELLEEIRKIPPTPNRIFGDINMYIRGKWDSLYEKRYFSEPEDERSSKIASEIITPGEKWVNFNRFLACLVRRTIVSEEAIFGFFCLRDILEYSFDTLDREFNAVLKPTTFKSKPITMEKLLGCDVKAAVCWVSQAMFDTDNRAFGKSWTRGIETKTDMWNGEPGMSIERWRLWKERFELISEREDLHPNVRKSASEAANMIASFDSASSIFRENKR
jgi:hypothetical protein